MHGHSSAGRRPRCTNGFNRCGRVGVVSLVIVHAATGLVAACTSPASPSAPAASPGLDIESVLDAAWRSLEPNTSSGDRVNWEAVAVRQVTGGEEIRAWGDRPYS
jgi:hypothetical protein